ncbi:MAG: cytochrome P450 [Rivularia sp. (in: cyanobacteria)]
MNLPNTLNKPAFLQKLQWIFDPVGYMEGAVKEYPDIFTAEVVGFGDNLIFVNQPEAIQEILTNDRKKFNSPGGVNQILQPLIGDFSVIMLDGEPHKRRRQLLIPPFHGERMRAYGQLICDIAEKVFQILPINQTFITRSVMQEISMQVILQAVFGLYEGKRFQKIKELMAYLSDTFSSPFSSSFLFFDFLQQDLGAWSPWGKFVRQRAKVDQLIYAEIAERRKNSQQKGDDILSLLMEARYEDGTAMTDKELRDELMTLLFAGHETTATAMAWALYWIHHTPGVKEKLLQELDTVDDFSDLMGISRLPYLSAVCNETLRITPVAMLTFARQVEKSIEMLGQKLESGRLLFGCIYLLHQREDLYPQPKQFKPERFLERQFSPYEFMPFGGGVRRCIGDALAMFEMKLVLATVMSRYEFTLADNKPEVPRRRGVTLAPANGVKMKINQKLIP